MTIMINLSVVDGETRRKVNLLSRL